MENDPVVKIRYTISFFDIGKFCTAERDVYELYSNGYAALHCYKTGSRKCVRKRSTSSATAVDFQLLCEKLKSCIANATEEHFVPDDIAGELRIYHLFNRVEMMTRGYGSKGLDVGMLVSDYLQDKAKILLW